MKKTNIINVSIALGLAVLALTAVVAGLAFDLNHKNDLLENSYSRSLYDASQGLENIEVKLSKFIVSGSKEQQQLLAEDIWRQSADTAGNLTEMPLEHESVYGSTKFVNQLGDYIYTVSKKLSKGGEVSEEEYGVLGDFHERCLILSGEMKQLASMAGNELRFVPSLNRDKAMPGKNNPDTMFGENQKELMDYPVLIYDGPFSDATDIREYRYLDGMPEVSAEEARTVAGNLLKYYRVLSINVVQQAEDTERRGIKIFEIEANINDGRTVYIQVTKIGGKPLMVNVPRSVKSMSLTEADAFTTAVNYAERAGFGTLKPVWIEISGGIAYVNLAPEQNDVILYPDLVKVKVAMDDGEVLGMESTNYILNHGARDNLKPTISKNTAKSMLNTRLNVDNMRLALIPKNNNREVLTYEFYCENNGLSYMIYINAYDGSEENILRVVNTAQGRLLS